MRTDCRRVKPPAACVVLALFVLAVVSRETAAEEPNQIEKNTAAVARAFDEGDRLALEQCARDASVDPWIIVEELGYAGRADAAEAFASAIEGKMTAALVAYARSLAGRAPDREVRAVLDRVAKALRGGRPADALEASDGYRGDLDTVMRVQIVTGRAHALRRLDRPAESSVEFLRAAEAAHETGWLAEAARLYRQGGRGMFHARRYAEAEAEYRRSLAVYEELEDAVHIAILTASVARTLKRQARYPEALEWDRKALLLFEEQGANVGVIEVLYDMGEIHSQQGRPRDALPLMVRALELAEARRDGGRIVRGLLNVSAALLGLGRVRESLPHLYRAKEIAEHMGDEAQVAGTLINVGLVHLRLADYPAALEAYRMALLSAEAAESDSDIAAILQNTGVLYRRLGDDKRALDHFTRALAAAERLGDRPQIASLHGNLGNILGSLGRNEEAEKHLLRSVALAEDLGVQRSLAAALSNLAGQYGSTGRLPEALSTSRRALAIAEEIGDPNYTAATRVQVAIVYERMGRYENALANVDAADELLEESPDPDLTVRLRWTNARVLLAQGRPEAAAVQARQAAIHLAALAEGLGDEEGASARETFAGVYEAGMRGTARSKDIRGLTFFFEHGRAGQLREGLGARSALSEALMPAALREDLALAQAAEQRAMTDVRKAWRERKLKAMRAAKRALVEAQGATRDVVARVQREARKAASIVFPEPDDLAAIRARLQPGEALLYYGLTKEEALALVVRIDDVRLVNLGPTQRVEDAVDALLLDEEPHLDVAALGALRALVATPLGLDGSVKRVLVSPMGRLCYVPFALLLPHHELAYVPSGTAYGLLKAQQSSGGSQILAIGDPAYGAVAQSVAALHRGVRDGRLPLLPATREEVEAVGTVRLLGERASESGFRDALRSRPAWRAVHFACHGLLDPENPTMSSLALTPETTHDGFLTCLEIFGMDIPADFVVLSACETAKGRIFLTEGIVGLTRAFMFAGSPRVICSLWKVDDEATRALMIKFYELWNPKEGEGLGAATALKQAQEYIRDHPDHSNWEHPYYWAAWVLWGLPH